MTTRIVAGGDMTPEQRRVHRVEHILRRDGGSPGSALEGLAAIVEDQTWRKVPRDVDDPRPFETFRQLVEARRPFGLQYSIKQLEALLQLHHPHEETKASVRERMNVMRTEVRQLVKQETRVAHDQGGDRRSPDFQNSNTDLKRETAEHVISRLKKKAPALAERVIAGEISAHAAALQAGIRKPRFSVRSDDPAAAARAQRKHMNPDDLAALAKLLTDNT